MEEHTDRIIDAHVHVGRGQIREDPLLSNITPDDILRMMAESGVERSIIFAPYCPRGYAEANSEIAQYTSDHPRHFVGFGRLRSLPLVTNRPSAVQRGMRKIRRVWTAIEREAGRDGRDRRLKKPQMSSHHEGLDEVRRCFEQHKFAGIKIHPVQDGLPSAAVFQFIADHRRPVLFHCGAGVDLDLLEQHLVRRFDMPIILAHMGGYPAERSLYTRALAMAERYAHVYLDTSYVFFQYVLEQALSSCPTKLVFGSDAPGVHPATALACLNRTRASAEVKRLVLAENIERILGGAAA